MKQKVAFIIGLVTLLLINGVGGATTSVNTGGINATEGASLAETVLESDASVPVEYVEGLNDVQPVDDGMQYVVGGWWGIEYTPTVSYYLRRVELIAGEGTGEFIVQLRHDSGGWPSDRVQRETSFTMVNLVSWQGADFATSYSLTAGTTYWIVFMPVPSSQVSVATSGTVVTHVMGSGVDNWVDKGRAFFWMAKFYREDVEFQYHVRVSPFLDVLHLNIGGSVICGVAEYTYFYSNQPVLGTYYGDNFYICIDFTRDDHDHPIYYEMALIVGHVSTRSGDLYQTTDGKSWVGPTSVTFVPVASPEGPTEGPSLARLQRVEPEPKGWPPTYHIQVSPFTDVLHVNVDGPVIHGVDNTTAYYNQPVLGTYSGDGFYIFIDGLKNKEGQPLVNELIMIAGTISTRSGNMYLTPDGMSWTGPVAVTLVSK